RSPSSRCAGRSPPTLPGTTRSRPTSCRAPPSAVRFAPDCRGPTNRPRRRGEAAMTASLKVWLEAEGRLLRLRLSRPKANLIDAGMIAALDEALAAHLDHPALSAVLVDAEGPHFSFGASVEEHMPDQC